MSSSGLREESGVAEDLEVRRVECPVLESIADFMEEEFRGRSAFGFSRERDFGDFRSESEEGRDVSTCFMAGNVLKTGTASMTAADTLGASETDTVTILFMFRFFATRSGLSPIDGLPGSDEFGIVADLAGID